SAQLSLNEDSINISSDQIEIAENPHSSIRTDQTDTVQMGCLKNQPLPPIKTHARQIRLVGELCSSTQNDKDDPTLPEILNQTNGFLATVFLPRPRLFTSDYIYLAKGTNQILVSWNTSAESKISTQVTFVRLLPSDSRTSPQ
ncbi:MAG: hypothetical protein KDD35_05815, partial [Bdellovibrionales bacterium]|nr:hypothetical protein [Bdellovibrionales bacterium]